MSDLFPHPVDWSPPEVYAKVGSSWYRTSTFTPDDGEVRITVRRPDQVDDHVRRHALGQHSHRTVWVVRLPADAVEEIVNVSRFARYRGATVSLESCRDGVYMTYLVTNSPQVAAELGFDGDGRIVGFNKEIPAAELTDLRDEVEVCWRRGVGRVS